MSFASSSSANVVRCTARQSRRGISTRVSSRPERPFAARRPADLSIPTRSYSPTAFAVRPESSEPPYQPRRRPSTSSSSLDTYSGSSSTTPESAQAYLTDLLHLPPTRQFPPALALQILTHKSYRFNHMPRVPTLSPPPTSAEQANASRGTNHNARITFMGRRALQTYLTMFLHSAVATSGADLRNLDFLRGKTLEDRLDIVRDTRTLGRLVAPEWQVGEHMRWDGNKNALKDGAVTVKGSTVEAIVGAVFTQFGSPAAQRAFHLFVLPHLSNMLYDPILKERVQTMQRAAVEDLNGGILVGQ